MEFVSPARAEAAPGPGDQAVVGADDGLPGELYHENAAIGADAGVDDGQMICPGLRRGDCAFELN